MNRAVILCCLLLAACNGRTPANSAAELVPQTIQGNLPELFVTIEPLTGQRVRILVENRGINLVCISGTQRADYFPFLVIPYDAQGRKYTYQGVLPSMIGSGPDQLPIPAGKDWNWEMDLADGYEVNRGLSRVEYSPVFRACD